MELQEMAAQGGEALLAGWLSVTLVEGLCVPEDLPARSRGSASAEAGDSDGSQHFFIQGAKAALAELAPAGAWLGERIQAVQFLCAHSAAMQWLGQANSPYEPEPLRDNARKIAVQLFALTSRQLATLARLKDQRRREREAEERRAFARKAQEAREQIARDRAFTAELERMMKLGGKLGALGALAEEAEDEGDDEMADEAAAQAAAVPKAVGAAVPEPPAAAEAGLNRQQRRALARRRRKQGRKAET